jgi:hypothetical protein
MRITAGAILWLVDDENRVRRARGPENFSSVAQKDFCNSIGTKRDLSFARVNVRFC